MNIPGKTMFAVNVGATLRELRTLQVEVLDVRPRYWPSLRLLGRMPGVREVLMWNCVILARKRA
jgi:hypothetical protein